MAKSLDESASLAWFAGWSDGAAGLTEDEAAVQGERYTKPKAYAQGWYAGKTDRHRAKQKAKTGWAYGFTNGRIKG